MGDRHAQRIGALRRLAERVSGELGLELVELALRGPVRRRILRLDIDREGPVGVSLEDCQRVSELFGRELEQTELLDGSYVLEVSSPGVDRPIRSADDIRRNRGRRVVVRTNEPLAGRRQFRGVLLGSAGGCLELAGEDEGESVLRIPLAVIEKAQQEVAI